MEHYRGYKERTGIKGNTIKEALDQLEELLQRY